MGINRRIIRGGEPAKLPPIGLSRILPVRESPWVTTGTPLGAGTGRKPALDIGADTTCRCDVAWFAKKGETEVGTCNSNRLP